MREPAITSTALNGTAMPAASRDRRSVELVCLALAMALLALAARIVITL